jgi:hypothetical protein
VRNHFPKGLSDKDICPLNIVNGFKGCGWLIRLSLSLWSYVVNLRRRHHYSIHLSMWGNKLRDSTTSMRVFVFASCLDKALTGWRGSPASNPPNDPTLSTQEETSQGKGKKAGYSSMRYPLRVICRAHLFSPPN